MQLTALQIAYLALARHLESNPSMYLLVAFLYRGHSDAWVQLIVCRLANMRRAAGLPHVDSQVVPWITLCCRSQSTRPILQISHHCPLEKKEVPIWNEEEALGQVSYEGRAKEECEWEEIKYIAQRLHTTRG